MRERSRRPKHFAAKKKKSLLLGFLFVPFCFPFFTFPVSSRQHEVVPFVVILTRSHRVWRRTQVSLRPWISLSSWCVRYRDWRDVDVPDIDCSDEMQSDILYPPSVMSGCHVDSRLFQEQREWAFIIDVIKSTRQKYAVYVQCIYRFFMFVAVHSTSLCTQWWYL